MTGQKLKYIGLGLVVLVIIMTVIGGLSGVSVAQSDVNNSSNNSTPSGIDGDATGNKTTQNNNTTQTTGDNNTSHQSGNKDQFKGNVDSSGSQGASVQNMYINTTYHPNASTDELSGTIVAGSTAGNVYLVQEKYPDSGATLHLYSERNVTVTISWYTGNGRGEAKKVKLRKGLNIVSIKADGNTGSITVPVPDRPTNEIYEINKGLSLDGWFGTITIKHVLGTTVVVVTGIPLILFWLSGWFRRNVLDAYHMLGASNLLKLFKP